MPPKFGTSGLRGLVTELTPDLVSSYVRSFLSVCDTGDAVRVGWDLRPSSPDIKDYVVDAIRSMGHRAVLVGAVPTPALALGAATNGDGAIMVTGSHIPADRNGLKFYTVQGEISKTDETAILAQKDAAISVADPLGDVVDLSASGADDYVSRYIDAFGAGALDGVRVGVYQHSSVARDIMVDVLAALGAVPVAIGKSDTFIPVDTEAVDPSTRAQFKGWVQEHDLAAMISTDGDADRPMVVDQNGHVVAGDVLGALTARLLGAKTLCTPVSSNTMIEQMPEFTALHRTRIGSPFVIEAMENCLAGDPAASVVGYEANGGFLLGFTAKGPAGPLAALMTRDCLLPMLAPLYLMKTKNVSLSALVADLPDRVTAANRLVGIAPERSQEFLADLAAHATSRRNFFVDVGDEVSVDQTDGLRVTFADHEVVHLRPSGNAPEFRCYTEAETTARATQLLDQHLARLSAAFEV